MPKIDYEKILNRCLSKRVDFAEIFYENTKANNTYLLNDKIDRIETDIKRGIGIRLAYKDREVYLSTNNLEENNINRLIDELLKSFEDGRIIDDVKLSRVEHNKCCGSKEDIPFDLKSKLLHRINKYAKEKDNRINQVQIKLFEEFQNVEIANSKGNITSDLRTRKRMDLFIYIKDKDKLESTSKRIAYNSSYDEMLNIDYEKIVDELVEELYEKLESVPCVGGQMPVVIGNGFGGVIFHEACVHPLEASTIARNSGIFVGCLGKKIASDKVTIIDDGTLKNEWGSTNIDDEGNPTQRNVLIENGILKSYLIDELNGRKMGQSQTGSSRRESYLYSPTSRMNNTYLDKGNDKIEDMIKSIKFGLYAKRMGGGSVEPITADFNFAVTHGYIIRDGKICEPISDACLIGNGKDILKNVEMVSDDLELSSGYCGASSGYVPTHVGEPTIKVSNILVSGVSE